MDNSEGLCGCAAAFAAGPQVASGELTACDKRKHQLYIAPVGRERSRFAVQRRITPSSCAPGRTYVTQPLQVALRGTRLSQNHAELRFRRHAFIAHCVLAPCFRHATSRWTAVANHAKARPRLCIPRPRRSMLPSKSQRAFGACSKPPARRQRVAPPRCGCVRSRPARSQGVHRDRTALPQSSQRDSWSAQSRFARKGPCLAHLGDSRGRGSCSSCRASGRCLDVRQRYATSIETSTSWTGTS